MSQNSPKFLVTEQVYLKSDPKTKGTLGPGAWSFKRGENGEWEYPIEWTEGTGPAKVGEGEVELVTPRQRAGATAPGA